jgi:hypothetical protein
MMQAAAVAQPVSRTSTQSELLALEWMPPDEQPEEIVDLEAEDENEAEHEAEEPEPAHTEPEAAVPEPPAQRRRLTRNWNKMGK